MAKRFESFRHNASIDDSNRMIINIQPDDMTFSTREEMAAHFEFLELFIAEIKDYVLTEHDFLLESEGI